MSRLTAALFGNNQPLVDRVRDAALAELVGDTLWAHLDIAGTMQSDTDDVWRSKGATGFGTRTPRLQRNEIGGVDPVKYTARRIRQLGRGQFVRVPLYDL